MICFRDMTFCSSDCVNDKCYRHFGTDDQEAANEWWEDMRGKAPIAFSDFSNICTLYEAPKQ